MCSRAVAVHAFNLSTWEMEAGRSEIQGKPLLHSKLEANLGYVRPCLKTKHHKDKLKFL